MNNLKEQLMRWIDEDREKIIGFLCDFVRAKSPNPPGDTTLAAAHVASFLESHQLPFRRSCRPRSPRSMGRVSSVPCRRAERTLDTRPMERGDRGRQDLR